MTRVTVDPSLIRWARERAGLEWFDLVARFPKIEAWEDGSIQPTLRQLEQFAEFVHVPLGYLFLPSPPEEHLPIKDFRTHMGRGVRRPSPNLLDTIYSCQERQEWYREFVLSTDQQQVGFVESVTTQISPDTVAEQMRKTLGFNLDERRSCPTWTDAFRLFVRLAEQSGVLVMVNGVVGSNTKRPLDPNEFRGFALSDRVAPLVFINGADTKAAQMFTLAHELAHLWLGTSALSDLSAAPIHSSRTEEIWCNRVAAEFLAPKDIIRSEIYPDEPLHQTILRLTRLFKVSSLVIIRRLLDIGHIDRDTFDDAWESEMVRFRLKSKPGSGGDFYRTTLVRVGKRFARTLFESTLEGKTLYRDAYKMLGISKAETFHNLAKEAGVQL